MITTKQPTTQKDLNNIHQKKKKFFLFNLHIYIFINEKLRRNLHLRMRAVFKEMTRESRKKKK